MTTKRILALCACLISGILLATGNNAAPKEIDPLNAVIRIDTNAYLPNYWLPWLDHGQDGGSGSGVVIAGNKILTNAHNVTYATYITVTKQSQDDPFEAHVKAIDHDCDLALLEVDDPRFFADIKPMELGETPPAQTPVVAAGYPIGGDGISITQGVISRIELHQYLHSWKYLLAGQLDAAINPGNSGGPVICRGRVVGIAFQGSNRGEGLGYMIPSEIIRHFLKDMEDGHVDGFGLLGFSFSTLENADTREFLKMQQGQTGIRLTRVFKSNQEHLKLNDVLLAVDGVPISNSGNIRLATGVTRSFNTLIHQKQIGEIAKLTLLRDGKEITVNLPVRKIEYQCKDELYDKLPDYYIAGGFVFTTLSYSFLDEWGKKNPPSELMQRMFKEKNAPDEEIIVLSIVLADKLNQGYQGLRAQILSKVNGKPVRNLKELISIIEKSNDKFITFQFGESDFPATLNLKKLKAQTPVILQRYRIPSDRSKSLQK